MHHACESAVTGDGSRWTYRAPVARPRRNAKSSWRTSIGSANRGAPAASAMHESGMPGAADPTSDVSSCCVAAAAAAASSSVWRRFAEGWRPPPCRLRSPWSSICWASSSSDDASPTSTAVAGAAGAADAASTSALPARAACRGGDEAARCAPRALLAPRTAGAEGGPQDAPRTRHLPGAGWRCGCSSSPVVASRPAASGAAGDRTALGRSWRDGGQGGRTSLAGFLWTLRRLYMRARELPWRPQSNDRSNHGFRKLEGDCHVNSVAENASAGKRGVVTFLALAILYS